MKIFILKIVVLVQLVNIYKNVESLPTQIDFGNQILTNQLEYLVNQEENVLQMMKNLINILHIKSSLGTYDDHVGYNDNNDEYYDYIYDYEINDELNFNSLDFE